MHSLQYSGIFKKFLFFFRLFVGIFNIVVVVISPITY
jgi:hypothetical protein